MDITLRLLKQFTIPALIAVAWTLFKMGLQVRNWDIGVAIAHFATSFFLASWATGQVFRVQKESRQERGLSSIESRVATVLDRLDATSRDLISYITGAESYCHLHISPPIANGGFDVYAIHIGKHPIYDVHVRIVDVDQIARIGQPGGPLDFNQCEHHFRFPLLTPNMASGLGRIPAIGNTPLHKYNIFFTARSGTFMQLFRMGQRPNGEWATATRVYAGNKLVHEEVKPGLEPHLEQDDGWNVHERGQNPN